MKCRYQRETKKRRMGCNQYIMMDKMKDELQNGKKKIMMREILDKVNDI